jgi:hypothetical protein
MASEGSWFPKTWGEAIPYLVWFVIIVGIGLEACAHLFNRDFWTAGVGFMAMLVVSAAAIYWTRIRASFAALDGRWLVASCLVFIFALAVSPFVEQRRWPFSLSELKVVALSNTVPEPIPPLPLAKFNLATVIGNDFPGTSQTNGDVSLTINDKTVTIRIIDFRNAEDGAEFLGVYIPKTSVTYSIIKQVLIDYQALLQKLGRGGISVPTYGQEGELSTDLVTFTKLIFVYYEGEGDLSLQQPAELENFSKYFGLRVILRGYDYLSTRPREPILKDNNLK